MGTTEELLGDPQHPYTRALLSVVPESQQHGAADPHRRGARPDADPGRLPLPPALPGGRRPARPSGSASRTAAAGPTSASRRSRAPRRVGAPRRLPCGPGRRARRGPGVSTRLTYTSGASSPETDAAFEAALADVAPRSRPRRSPTSSAGSRRTTAPEFERERPQPRPRRSRAGRTRRRTSSLRRRSRVARAAQGALAPARRRRAHRGCCARAGEAISERHLELAARRLARGGQEPHGVDRGGAGGRRPDRGLLRADRAPRRLLACRSGSSPPEETQRERAAAVRRVRRHRAVQLPRRARHRHDRRRARGRQHRRPQAVGADAAGRARSSARRSPPRGCREGVLERRPRRRGRPAARWPRARSTASSSPARPRSAGRSAGASRTGALRAARRSPRWAARTPRSWPPRPTSTPPRRGSRRSAFGFSGQKCSACSRAIVRRRRVARRARRAAAPRAAAELVLGDPVRPRRVHRAGRRRRARSRAIEAAIAEAEPRRRGRRRRRARSDLPRPLRRADHRRGPARAATGSPARSCSSRSSRSRRSARSTRRWRRPTRSTTGSPPASSAATGAELDAFLDEIEAGVVYVNRRAGATTGAWPGFQSFCGWKSSGSTGKGGLGPYYVQQFMREQSRTVVTP